jgi:hypothetical protein
LGNIRPQDGSLSWKSSCFSSFLQVEEKDN